MRPLDGLRVLDFTHVLAGPFAARILGDLGADVVKVNSVTRPAGDSDPYYIMWNRNKRALALDMSTPRAAEICRRLCEKADIVIDNFSIGVLDRWGVGYESVREANPRIIYLSMSGMGEGGPWSKFVTYAPTIHALSGLTHMTSVPGREDIGIGFSYNDHQAGLHGVVVLLAALEARRISGRGQRIDMSQFEIGVNFSGPALLDLFANGRAAQPTGNRLPYDVAAPHNCYPCEGEERWVAISVNWAWISCLATSRWMTTVSPPRLRSWQTVSTLPKRSRVCAATKPSSTRRLPGVARCRRSSPTSSRRCTARRRPSGRRRQIRK